MPSTPYTLVPILLALSYAVQVSADPTDSFPNITLAPPRHQLAKRDSYANLQVQWPDKTLMYMASEDKHWWSDEPWASGWFYTPGHTGTIDPVTVMFYEGGYDWKRNHATAQATCTGGYSLPAPAGQTAVFTMTAAAPYITPSNIGGAFFSCAEKQ